MKKILFIYPADSTFVQKDIGILSEKYIVNPYHVVFRKSTHGFILDFISYSFKIFKKILKSDYVYIWFADYHSLVPAFLGKIFHKRVLIILGGYDIARISRYGYGALLKSFRGWCVKKSVNLSFTNLPVSDYIRRKAQFVFPNGTFHTVYNAFDDNLYKTDAVVGEGIITVGKITRERDVYIKGIDKFIEVARQMPEYEFVIVGVDGFDLSFVIKDIPINVKIYGLMKAEDLRMKLIQSNVYCQLSEIESFGLAVIEAVSCGCVPVVSRAGALPEISGDYGFVVNTIDEAVYKIRIAREINLEKREGNTLSVAERYSVERRKNQILSIMEE